MFVSPTCQSYHPDPAVREEAGTPAIVDSIRAGLVFALKEAVGAEEIRRREGSFARRALASWGRNPQLRILGGSEPERLAIVSFGVRHPRGWLHGDFVVAVLSDLFGIQARSGCFCAGPYIHRLHPIDETWSAAMDEQARQGYAGATLGLSRVSFGYYISEAVFGYIVDAVHLLAEHAWKLLPLYRFDPRTGRWRHAHARPERLPALRDLTFDSAPAIDLMRPSAPESALAHQLAEARRILSEAPASPAIDPPLSPAFDRIRWFPLPGEAHANA